MSFWKTSISSNYKQDMALLNYPFLRYLAVGLLVLGLLVPLLTSSYFVHLTNLAILAILAALSLNLLTGYCGLVSLGTGGFLCAGGFITAIFTIQLTDVFWVSIVGAAVTGGVLGLICGLPALRLKGIYLLLSTLAIHFIIIYICGLYQISGGYTGGIRIENPNLGWGLLINTSVRWYYFLLVILLILTTFYLNLERTHIYRAWVAIRDKDIAASILGINVGLYKLIAFVVSSALISMTGSLTAYYSHFVAYEEFSIWTSVLYLAMLIVGGMGSVAGCYLGAFTVIFIPYALHWVVELLGFSGGSGIYLSSLEEMCFGLIIILFLVIEPRGLVGIFGMRIRPYFELWPFKYRRSVATKR
jgi:branched-chain amino acid transport system permease protein